MSLISRSSLAAAIIALLFGVNTRAYAVPISTQDLSDPNLPATLSFLGHSDDLAALSRELSVSNQWTHALAWPEPAFRRVGSDSSRAKNDQGLIDHPHFPTPGVTQSSSVAVPENGMTAALLVWVLGVLIFLSRRTGISITQLHRSGN